MKTIVMENRGNPGLGKEVPYTTWKNTTGLFGKLSKAYTDNPGAMNLVRFIISLFKLPAILIHELMHVLAAILCGEKVTYVTWISNGDGSFGYKVGIKNQENLSRVKVYIINLMPLAMTAIPIILFLTENTLAHIIGWYFVFNIGRIMPSMPDIDAIRYSYKTQEEIDEEHFKNIPYDDESLANEQQELKPKWLLEIIDTLRVMFFYI